MANPSIYVYYRASDGRICASVYGKPGNPPDYPADLNGHDAVLEIALVNDLPRKDTHKVDTTTTPHTVVPLTAEESTAITNAERKRITEHSLARHYLQKAEMERRNFDTTEIDAVIAQCEADLIRFSS